MITKIEISGYKNISSFTVEPERINILVGANSSGKSSVLQALQFAVAVAQAASKDKGRVDTKRYVPINSMLYVSGVNEFIFNQSSGRSYKDEDIIQRIVEMSFTFLSGEHITEVIKSIDDADGLSVTFDNSQVFDLLGSIENPFSVYVPGLSGLSRQESQVNLGTLRRSIARGDANMVLRNVLHQLFNNESRQYEFNNALNKVFPGHELLVEFNPHTDEHINVLLRRNGGSIVPLDNAGTGFLQIIQILSYLFLFKPKLLLLDEPDSHLHPSNQRRIVQLLAMMAVEWDFQVFIATHSRHILDELFGQASVIWMREGSVQEVSSYREILVNLGALDGVERLYSQEVKYIVLTEDEKTRYLEIILESILDPKSFEVWSYKGCSNLHTAEVLADFIRNISPATKIIIHRDRDYYGQEYLDAQANRFKKQNLSIFYTKGVDIEGHFIDLQHLKALYPENQQGLNVSIETVYYQALADCDLKLREKARKSLQEVQIQMKKSGSPVKSEDECDTWSRSIDFIQSPQYIHGKIMLAALRSIFHKLNSKSIHIEQPSPHLIHDELRLALGT